MQKREKAMLPSIQMSASDLAGQLQKSKVQETAQGGIAGFLRFNFRDGEWTYGRDQDDVTDDTVIVNTTTIAHGWVLWHEGKAEKSMVRFTEELPEPMPGKGNDTPSEARGFMGAFPPVDGGDPEQVAFETNSYGGRQGVDTLLLAIKQKAASGSAFLYPAVKLTSSSYKNKKHGSTIFNPVLEIIGWTNENGEYENEAKRLETGSHEEPPSQDQTAETEAAPEAAPKRRRRRNSAE